MELNWYPIVVSQLSPPDRQNGLVCDSNRADVTALWHVQSDHNIIDDIVYNGWVDASAVALIARRTQRILMFDRLFEPSEDRIDVVCVLTLSKRTEYVVSLQVNKGKIERKTLSPNHQPTP